MEESGIRPGVTAPLLWLHGHDSILFGTQDQVFRIHRCRWQGSYETQLLGKARPLLCGFTWCEALKSHAVWPAWSSEQAREKKPIGCTSVHSSGREAFVQRPGLSRHNRRIRPGHISFSTDQTGSFNPRAITLQRHIQSATYTVTVFFRHSCEGRNPDKELDPVSSTG